MEDKRIRFFGRWQNLAFAFIIAIPGWIVAHTFTEQWQIRDDESVATAIVILFTLALFSGRYLAILWQHQAHQRMQSVLLMLTVLLIAPALTMFVLFDFPSEALRGLKLALTFLCFILFGLSSGMLIKLIKSYQDLQLMDARLAADKSRAELKALQAQLSPHFLFNTLNNLYGLSIARPEKLPDLILKLSNLLHYSVYGAKELLVPLKDELAYIQHYIDFERIRMDNRLVLEVDLEQGRQSAVQIAPLLLIVLVENAFKHARESIGEELFIGIQLRMQRGELVFYVENTCSATEPAGIVGGKESGGFGLANLRERLELIYPGKHILQVQPFNGRFRAELRLKI